MANPAAESLKRPERSSGLSEVLGPNFGPQTPRDRVSKAGTNQAPIPRNGLRNKAFRDQAIQGWTWARGLVNRRLQPLGHPPPMSWGRHGACPCILAADQRPADHEQWPLPQNKNKDLGRAALSATKFSKVGPLTRPAARVQPSQHQSSPHAHHTEAQG
jgi:hypothetical protein